MAQLLYLCFSVLFLLITEARVSTYHFLSIIELPIAKNQPFFRKANSCNCLSKRFYFKFSEMKNTRGWWVNDVNVNCEAQILRLFLCTNRWSAWFLLVFAGSRVRLIDAKGIWGKLVDEAMRKWIVKWRFDEKKKLANSKAGVCGWLPNEGGNDFFTSCLENSEKVAHFRCRQQHFLVLLFLKNATVYSNFFMKQFLFPSDCPKFAIFATIYLEFRLWWIPKITKNQKLWPQFGTRRGKPGGTNFHQSLLA